MPLSVFFSKPFPAGGASNVRTIPVNDWDRSLNEGLATPEPTEKIIIVFSHTVGVELGIKLLE
jgi:hypothetical protein